jgi:hypothetical protein
MNAPSRWLLGLTLVGVLWVTGPAVAQSGESGGGGAGSEAERDAEPERRVDPRLRTLRRMMRPITVEFEGDRLRDIVEFFRETTGAAIDPAWIDEKDATGLDPEAEVTASIENRLALDALEIVLEEVSEDPDFDAATWQLTRDGRLEIGPRSRLNRRAFVKTYYVDDLLMRIPDFEDVPDLDLDSVLGGGQGGGGQSPFDDDDEADDALLLGDREEALDELVEIIRLAVEPDQWRANGGEGGVITMFQQTMVVRAPDYIHRQINGYDFVRGDYGAFVQRYRDRLRRDAGGVQRYGPGADASDEVDSGDAARAGREDAAPGDETAGDESAGDGNGEAGENAGK